MDNEFQKILLATFRQETRERLDVIGAALVELERNPAPARQMELVEAIFRETHSLKGAARSVGMVAIEAVSHELETIFAALKRQELAPAPQLYDLLHTAVDTLARLLPSLEAGPTGAQRDQLRELGLRLQRAGKGHRPPASPAAPLPDEAEEIAADKSAAPQTVRIAADKLDGLLRQTEGLLTAKLAAAQRTEELRELGNSFALWEKKWKKMRPALRNRPGATGATGQRDQLLDLLDWSHACLKTAGEGLARLAKTAEHDRLHLNAMVAAVLEEMREVLLLPCASLLALLPKTVRDLARDRGKEVDLIVSGETIEIDRRLLEEMKDPLVHLLRNCVDHGIEPPTQRQRLGKAPRGTISLAMGLLPDSRVELVIVDDGAGIDTARLREAAVGLALLTPEAAAGLHESELLPLIFASGISTSPIIDNISGRGLGLAIVREKVDRLGGTIAVDSTPGRGTTFRITLPLTLSTFRGILVEAAGRQFVVATSDVERVARREKSAIATVENRETIELDGQAVAFVMLEDVLELPRQEREDTPTEQIPFFVLATGHGRIAFGVDQVLGEQEVVVKGLGNQLRRVRNIAGATVLGTGRVVPILHGSELSRSAVAAAASRGAFTPSEAPVHKTVLVAEDSITARTLLKNILEGAGYRVRTAVDGADAVTILKAETIDLVLSDVDMPRMNGFELTATIRRTRELSELPVVLVTSLDSLEDRERGIDAGADAYIVKSSFDQSNLLAVIRRLIGSITDAGHSA